MVLNACGTEGVTLLTSEEQPKVAFMVSALAKEAVFEQSKPEVPRDVSDALEWVAARSAQRVMEEREAIISSIEADAKMMWASGACEKWFGVCDAEVREVAATVNGPLMHELALRAEHCDVACVDFFRQGAPLLGKLEYSGIGDEKVFKEHQSLNLLKANCGMQNRKLLQTLREDERSIALLELTSKDAALGRMSLPMDIKCVDLDNIVLAPRFAVAQGLKEDGSEKVRAVDNETLCGVNGCCQPSEKLHNDRTSLLWEVMRLHVEIVGELPMLCKADVDAAFRRVPIRPEHRFAAYIPFIANGKVVVSKHMGMPFGAVASVHAWERVGALLTVLARRLLHLPMLRYVDDFFCPERKESVQHGLGCFTRLVRAVLGPSSLAERKLMWGMPLPILGVSVQASDSGMACFPLPDKVEKWISKMQNALVLGKMSPGEASKLAGALNWAASSLFNKLGRAMLIPLYRQQRVKHGRVGKELQLCLRWWVQVLGLQLHECRPWSSSELPVVHLFADARGEPPRLAAVLRIDGKLLFTELAPDEEVLNNFRPRKDAQIMGLELLAIALGMSTFAHLLKGRRVMIWSDNTGSERTTQKGRAKAFDHSCIVHCLWKRAAEIGMESWVDRVPTAENIADDPSREHYALLEKVGAVRIDPILDNCFVCPESWEALKLRPCEAIHKGFDHK